MNSHDAFRQQNILIDEIIIFLFLFLNLSFLHLCYYITLMYHIIAVNMCVNSKKKFNKNSMADSGQTVNQVLN